MAALSPTAATRSVQITQNLLSVSCVWPHGSHANASVQGVLLTWNMFPLKAS